MLITASFYSALEEQTRSALGSFGSIQNTLYLVNSVESQVGTESLAGILEQMEARSWDWQALRLTCGTGELFATPGSVWETALPEPGENQCVYQVVADDRGHSLVIRGTLRAGADILNLTARYDLSGAYAARGNQLRLFLGAYGIVVILGLLVAAALSAAMTRRLKSLTQAVACIAGGDLSHRSRLASGDEFGQLSRDIDAMADTLQENFQRLEQQMQRQEAFMGAFAHELKTPMTAIIGYADLLRQDDLDKSTRLMAAGYIFSEGQRLETLSHKLLELLLLDREPPCMRQVSLQTLTAEVEGAMAPVLARRGIRLVCKSDRGSCWVEPDLVRSLLYNLVDNEAKAMDGPGTIGVKASIIPGGCQFQVADSGRGMAREELSRITEAFYRVDKSRSRSQGGAGLGLALCRRIVELHRGRMTFASTPGKGTWVTVTLYGEEARDG